MHRIFAPLALCSAVSVWSGRAHACSRVWVSCQSPLAALPTQPMFIPANATVLPLLPDYGDMERPSSITLRKAGQSTPEWTRSWSLALPEKPAVDLTSKAGQSFELDISRHCNGEQQTKVETLEVREPAPLPTTLGTLKLRGTRMDKVNTLLGTSSCGGERNGQVAELEVELSNAAQPWAASLIDYHLIIVDPPKPYAVRFAGAGSVSKPGTLAMSVVCDLTKEEQDSYRESEELPGKYQVKAWARLPMEGNRYVETAPIEVDLTCDSDDAQPAGSETRGVSTENDAPTADSGSDGCSARGTSPSGQSNLIALIATTLCVLLARKRHRRAANRRP